uniref:Cilia and flagella associated protein 58 n=1 Tax=Malurus cyaneus samueli TaxID=2593467 RepID=A0A8C5TIR1_9PASS
FTQEKPDKPYLEESAFEALEKDSQEFISILNRDEALEKFRIEYEKLFAFMKKSRENEMHLMMKCRKLSAELVEKSSKVALLTKVTKDDEETISSLKLELEKAWKMVDKAQEREQKTKETINSLQKEILRLNHLMKERAGQEHNVEDLLKLQEEVTEERDQLLSEVVKLRQSLTEITERQQEIEKAKNEAEQSVLQLQQDIQLRQSEEVREARKKEKMENELKNLLAEMDNKQAEVQKLQQQIENNKEEQLKIQNNLTEQKILNEEAGKELEQLKMKNEKLTQESEQQSGCKICLQLIKLVISHQGFLKSPLKIVSAFLTAVPFKPRIYSLSAFSLDLEIAKKQADIDKRTTDGLVRERDMLNQNLIKATNATQKQIDLVKLHEQSKQHLESEIQSYKIEAQKQRKIIYQLEKERDSFIHETSELKEKILNHMKDLEIHQMQICDYEKEIQVQVFKLKQQQNFCETLRAERTLYSKNLIEAKDEIAEMKMKLRTATRQVDQLKEELKEKDAALEKAHEKEKLYVELRQVLARQPGPEAVEQLQQYRNVIREKTKQIKALSSELNMCETQNKEYKKQIERLNNELLEVKKKYLAQKRKEQQYKYGKIIVLSTQLSA